MRNQQIRLTEEDLHMLVEDAVKSYLINEGIEEGFWGGVNNAMRGLGNGNFHMMQNYRSGSYATSIQKYGQAALKSIEQFRGILNKSGAHQLLPQIDKMSEDLNRIMTNYTTIAQQSSNKNSVNAAAQQAQLKPAQPNNTEQPAGTQPYNTAQPEATQPYNTAQPEATQPYNTAQPSNVEEPVGNSAEATTGRQNINKRYANMNLNRESRRRLNKIIKESIKKTINAKNNNKRRRY